MHPDHHNKIIGISAAIVIVVVLVLGLSILVYNRKQTTAPPTPTQTKSQMELLTEAATASHDVSINDPEVQKLNKSATASKTGSSAGAKALIQTASVKTN